MTWLSWAKYSCPIAPTQRSSTGTVEPSRLATSRASAKVLIAFALSLNQISLPIQAANVPTSSGIPREKPLPCVRITDTAIVG